MIDERPEELNGGVLWLQPDGLAQMKLLTTSGCLRERRCIRPCAEARFPLIAWERGGCAFAASSSTRSSSEAVRGRCYSLRDARLPERRSEVGVRKYQARNGTFWMVDEWLPLPNGQVARFRKRKIPTKEQAVALAAKARAEAFEGRHFDRPKASKLVVEDAWKAYQPVSKRDNDTWQSEEGRAKHLIRHLGQKLATGLTVKDVDEYRTRRLAERTRRKRRPRRPRSTRKLSCSSACSTTRSRAAHSRPIRSER